MGPGQPGHGLGDTILSPDLPLPARWETALAAGGVVGPALFVTAWAVLGATKADYDPTRDAISRLAAVGSNTRPVMTAALVVLGAGMALYSGALRTRLGGPAWVSAAANAVTTWGIAALPLGSTYDTGHGIAAGLSYATLVAVPLLASPRLARRGRRQWAASAAVAGIVSVVCLGFSLAGGREGLFQRLGLTASQVWVVASAVALSAGTGPSDVAARRP